MSDSDLPKDRSGILTEQRNRESENLHSLSISECVDLFVKEDRKIIAAMEAAKPSIAAFLEIALKKFNNGGRIIYLGAGTSGRLGVLDASEMPPTFQIDPERFVGIIAGGDRSLRFSSEGKEDEFDGCYAELENLKLTSNDVIIGIAAGATTPYVHGAFSFAKQVDDQIITCLIACAKIEVNDTLDYYIYLETGPELVTGSTRMKAGTATKLTLNLISTTLMIQSGRVYKNLMVDLKASNEKLVDRAIRILRALTNLSREESFVLLKKADKSVKLAFLMFRLKVDLKEAKAILVANRNRLDLALGEL